MTIKEKVELASTVLLGQAKAADILTDKFLEEQYDIINGAFEEVEKFIKLWSALKLGYGSICVYDKYNQLKPKTYTPEEIIELYEI